MTEPIWSRATPVVDASAQASRPPGKRAGPGEAVDVWRATLQAGARWDPDPVPALSADERARLAGYRDPAAGRRFAVGRSTLRRLLAGYLGVGPESLSFRYGTHGKPALGGPWAGLGWEFNVAHTGDVLLCAITRGAPLGVDIEALRPVPLAERIARAHLSRAEWAEFEALAAPDRSAALLRAWTRKEAYSKAEGLGLHRPLREVEVTFRPGLPACLRRVSGAPPPAGWSLRAWAPLPGLTAALVTAGGDPALRFWSWPDDWPEA